MKSRLRCGLFLVFSALLCASMQTVAAPDRPAVEVIYVEPGTFTDIDPSDLLDDFRRYLEDNAARQIGGGQTLEISVTDIDMAGGFDLTKGQQYAHVRQMRETFPPHIDLSYVLKDVRGNVLKEGKRRLQDLSYLMRPRPKTETDLLFYEKLMISEWLAREFSD